MVSLSGMAQRQTDKLDRGLVAVKVSGGVYVGWKVFAEEYYDVQYNLYRDGVKVNASPITTSNYTDASGTTASKYTVAPVVRGVEKEQSAAVNVWANQYIDIIVPDALDRNGNAVTSSYEMNDVSLGDVDGDGVVEFVAKRNSYNTYNMSQSVEFHHLECYNIKGERLWWIDLGPNMLSGADEQRDIVLYDWDEDGKCEAILRGADNMIIHTADGNKIEIGDMTVDTRWDGIEYTSTGAEYLLYLNGETGVPYQIGPAEHPNYMDYPLTRGQDSDWGTGIIGHRSTKHYFGAPVLDGRKASIFLGRGAYTKHKMAAYDVDPITHALTQRWYWTSDGLSGSWFGQGYHNYGIADVDEDGRDEIVFGSMVIDDNGKGLSTTGLGHGDAQHCTDFDPYRKGLEFFACNESSPANNYRNATTSKLYYRLQSTSDDGRGLMANFSNNFPGSMGRSVSSGMISSVADKVIANPGFDIVYSDLNNRIYWDGDLCDEILNSPGTAREAKIEKPGTGRIFTSSGCNMNNSSKNNPGAQADIFGDWREEIVLRCGANLRIYTTITPTNYRIPTLWHDHQYRQAMVWQSIGYNQPPHKSYFLGQLEGITIAPPPLTMTGREEIANGGTITTAHNDKHIIVCEPNSTTINIGSGAQPYIATFNIPSWVQGNNSNANIKYDYFQCDVSGAFSGATRLVKQGDGILNLPAVEMTHTGQTDIWGGIVNFDGKMPNSILWMNRHTELNTSGTFNNIKMDYGAVLRPGGADAKGEVTANYLTLNFGAIVEIDVFAQTITSDVFKTKSLTLTTKDWEYGPQYMQPVLRIMPQDADTVAIGTYTIAEVENIYGDLSDLKVEGINGKKFSLKHEDGKLILDVSGVRDASSVVWTGNESNIWDYAGAMNFSLNGSEECFVDNDKVIFNDDAQQYSLQLSGSLPCDTINVASTKDYTFEGTGALTGTGTLVKEGTGTLTIKTDNTYKGGNRISGGTVSVSSLANATQAYGNLGAVTNAAAKFIIENGATLQTTAAVQCGSPISLKSDEGGVITNSADFVMNRSFVGTKLTKKGGGWLKLNSSCDNLNNLVIAGGTVQLIGHTVPAKNIEFQGGSLIESVEYGNPTYSINVPEGESGTWNLTGRGTYGSKITGKGTLTVHVPYYMATRTQIKGNWSQFEGTIIASTADGVPFTFDNSYGLAKGTLNIPSGIVVRNSAKVYAIGKVVGKGSLGGVCVFSQNAASGSNTWRLGNDEDYKWEGTIIDNSNFVKVGSGKLTLSGASTHTGASTVQEGQLHVNSGAKLGTGKLTINAGTLLTGTTKTAAPLTNSSIVVKGTVQPGILTTSTTGTIYVDNKNVTFESGSTLRIGVMKAATASNMGGTNIQGINKLTMNGTISIFLRSTYTPAVGDSIVLWKAASFAGTPSFDLPTLPSGLEWNTADITKGILRVAKATAIENIPVDEIVEVDVLNTSGTIVDTYTAPFGSVQTIFRQSAAPSGIYMLRIKTAGSTSVVKIMK